MEKIPVYESSAHAKTRLRYHVIFATKYRTKCLVGIEDEVIAAFSKAEEKSEFKIIKMKCDKDHIHFLIKFRPALSIEQVIRRMKQLSTLYLWQQVPSHLRRFYWKKKIVWSGGYFISTVGNVSENMVLEYIENQG